MHRAGALVQIAALLEVVSLHHFAGHVGIRHFNLSVLLLVVDAVAAQENLEVHLVLGIEGLRSRHVVVVCVDAACQHQTEQVGEQVALVADGHDGVVQCCILVLGEVQFAVEVTFPYHVLRHGIAGREHDAETVTRGRGLLLGGGCLRGGSPALGGLSHHAGGSEAEQYE